MKYLRLRVNRFLKDLEKAKLHNKIRKILEKQNQFTLKA